MNQRNHQIYEEKKLVERRAPNPSDYIKLADFAIFMIKLVQRLEAQTFGQLAENQHFFEKISEEKYVKSREGYVDMVLPKDPEEFLTKVARE